MPFQVGQKVNPQWYITSIGKDQDGKDLITLRLCLNDGSTHTQWVFAGLGASDPGTDSSPVHHLHKNTDPPY